MKFNKQLVILFLVTYFVSFGQNQKSEKVLFSALEKFIEQKSKDSILIYNAELLSLSKSNNTSFYYAYALLNDVIYNSKSVGDSEQKIEEALRIFKNENKSNFILISYEKLAKVNRSKSNFDKANSYNDSVINILINDKPVSFSENDRKEHLLSAYHNISGNFYYKGEYENALKNGLIAKKYSDSIEGKKFDKVDIGLGMINIALGRHENARKTFRHLIRNSEIKSLKKFGNMSLATSFYETREHDSSIYYYKQAKSISQDIRDYAGLAHILTNIGINETAVGNIYEAEKNLLEAISISETYNISQVKETSLIGLGEVYIKQGKPNEAINILLQVRDSAKVSKRFPLIRDSYELLSEAYYNKKDYKNALDYRELFITLKDSIKSADIIKNSEELQVKYETEKKEKENLELKQDASQKDLTIAKKNNYILFGSLVFAGILSSLVFIQLRKTKKKNKALQNSIEQREKAEKELETVRDNISKDFHDDLGNRLARITSLSDLVLTTSRKRDKENVLSAIKKIKEDSDILYSGTKDFMFSLKAKSDYTEELFTYLSDYGEEFFESFDVDFFVSKKMDQNVKLPYYWNRQIIMIFKEAMTNIVKHSNAKIVELEMYLEEKDLYISLKDNGQGFNINEIKRKNGLLNMTSRARKIDATLHITSNKNGTSINFDAFLPE